MDANAILKQDASMPIAIVGMGGRFPGEATNPDKLWDMVSKGRNALSEEDIARFDAPFFSITAKEAHAMDPQQRLALELSYEGLENAGISIEEIAGSNMSCYMASFTKDYTGMRGHDAEDIPLYEGTGNGAALISNRVSWFLDIKGPSLSLDTACSSSLVALHLACQSIRAGESTSAIVGGTNIILMPEMQNAMTSLHFLSPDSKSMSFDHKANGYARGEGAAVVILKPLADALRDGNVIRAVIRGTGVNQDGRTPGITVPSSKAQEELIRVTYASAGLDFKQTGYFEAHGTGTPVGDPLECAAIAATFGQVRPESDPLLIGSVKTNIGHMEGAAGLAGLVKAVYALERGQVPPNLWFEKANPRIPLAKWKLKVPTELTPWPTEGVRRASVNSFGYGGFHNTISDTPAVLKALPSTTPVADPLPQLLVWSSPEQKGADRTAASLASYVKSLSVSPAEESALLGRLSFTLSNKRSKFPWKSFGIASTLQEAIDAFEQPRKPERSAEQPTVAFAFTGQGAQWYAMGRDLFKYPVFRESIQAAASSLKQLGCEWDLVEELNAIAEKSRINDPALSQPACTALQVALVDLLSSWGVKPSVVVGHSSGEIAAAYAKRAISRESAWKVAYFRGLLSSTIKKEGAMLAAGLGYEDAQALVDQVTDGDLVVACINSPSSVTLSGDISAISQAQALLEERKVFNRKLMVKTAYHSPHMKAIEASYLKSISDISLATDDASVRMFSSVTGEIIEAAELANPSYWVSNLVNPVKFNQSLQAAIKHNPTKRRTTKNTGGINFIVEVGPHAALQGPIRQVLSVEEAKKLNILYVSLLKRDSSASLTAIEAMGTLFQRGYAVDVAQVNNSSKDTSAALVDMPPFAWNHSTKYWYESPISRAYRLRDMPRHDLVGARDEYSSEQQPSWRNYLRVSEIPWLEHHQVQSSILYPFAGMIVMAVEASRQVADKTKEIEGFQLRDISAGAAMIIPADEAVESKIQLRPWRAGSRLPDWTWNEFTISCRDRQGAWTQHCSGLIQVKYKTAVNPTFTNEDAARAKKFREEYQQITDAGLDIEDPADVYASLAELGLQWGPSFKSLVHIGSGHYQAQCAIEVPDTKSYMPENFEHDHIIHPATLDGIVQMIVPACSPRGALVDRAKIPRFVESVYISSKVASKKPGDKLYGYSRSTAHGFQESGCRVITLETMTEGIASASATTKSIKKLGACTHWGPDIEELTADEYETIYDLELACLIICKRVLRKFTAEDSKTFAPHHRLFYEYMQHQYDLAVEGKLSCQSSPIKKIDWLNTTEEFDAALLEKVSNESVDGKMLVRVAYAMNEILTGAIEPLQVLREDDLLTSYYRNVIGVEKVNPVLEEYVRQISHKRPLRVLEVGAGTGATTKLVLTTLGKRDDAAARLKLYTFTDISSGYFEPAAKDFSEYAEFLEYKILNIEKDPAEQGFPVGQYDIVIANNVIHACSSIDRCLAHCRSMLRPGGVLLLGELTTTMARVPMIFGTLPGWWLGENDNRKWGPRLSESEWDVYLRRHGFGGLHVSFRDDSREDVYQSSLIFSVAVETTSPPLPKNAVVVKPAVADPVVDAMASKLSELLDKEGVQVEVVSLKDVNTTDFSGKACIVAVESNKPLLHEIKGEDWKSTKKAVLGSRSTLWLTNGGTMECTTPESSLIVGLSRTIRGENPGLQFTTLDLDPKESIDSDTTCATISQIFKSKADPSNAEWEYALRNKLLNVPRLYPDHEVSSLFETNAEDPPAVKLPFNQPGRALALEIKVPGMLDTFQFTDCDEYPLPLGDREVEIKVKAVGMNFHDVMIAMGQIQDTNLGVECSGVVTRIGKAVTQWKEGDRVMTFRLGTYRTYIRNPEEMFQRMPDGMSFEEGGSIVSIYGTAVYSLFDVARLQKGESVLIHSAAGGFGQGAIIISQYIGAEIFVTVSTEFKKRFLMETYGIREDHIFNSRDHSFAAGIKRMTNGKGVDVVLNSLAGEGLRQSWLCVAPFGRFIELGKRDITGNTGLDMTPFLHNISFSGVNMLSVYRENVPLLSRILADVMKYWAMGVTKLVTPLKVMNFSQIEEAFRIMQTGKHIGKMVLAANDDDIVPIVPPKKKEFTLSSNATYIIPGGLGGLGRSLAMWMASKGARYLAFTSRSGASRPEAKALLDELAKINVQSKAFASDISNEAELTRVLQEIKSANFPAIRGVITFAMQLQDVFFENMTVEEFHTAVRPKVQVTRNLHQQLPKDLDFFICMSSVGGIVGSRGQGNYNAGNTYQDAVARHRRSLGLKGTSIDLGLVLGVGWAAVHGEALGYLNSGAMAGLKETEVLDVIEAGMAGLLPEAENTVGLTTGGMLKQGGYEELYWHSERRFGPVSVYDTQDNGTAGSGEPDRSEELRTALGAAQNLDEAGAAVCVALMRKLAKAMMMDEADLDSGRPANAYGVDSLVAVEIRAWVFKTVKSDISVFDILSNAPLATLAGLIASKSSYVPVAIRGEGVSLEK
ncbi:KR domain-containing protein [Trichoderma breve]|uniref:KR domain-containing protein n=1 Tax=Trichoderma breve TaxID=2034170 RepID=A0A9W9BBQ5_9HYPO|nr:KR domain-containing protein [Trichoderma breve]KAJ4859547.1 KR domain-containing protein [Trichoderma breve]